MRLLGIDYGTKRIGLAISDESGLLAFPKEIISNDAKVLEKIGKILREENIREIVVGESLNFKGELNTVAKRINTFISQLEEKFKLKTHRQKEFLTSVEARKAGRTKMDFQKTQAHSKIKKKDEKRADAGAAALILQRFLDQINKNDLSR